VVVYESEYCILRDETMRKEEEVTTGVLQVVSLHLLDNNKVRTGNFYSGRSPYWVNHVYMCLYCIVYLVCFISMSIYIIVL
jgi:hypothetical protein